MFYNNKEDLRNNLPQCQPSLFVVMFLVGIIVFFEELLIKC